MQSANMASVSSSDIRKYIRHIVQGADLKKISARKVRSACEQRFRVDLTERKTEIDQIIMSVVYSDEESDNDKNGKGGNEEVRNGDQRSDGSEKDGNKNEVSKHGANRNVGNKNGGNKNAASISGINGCVASTSGMNGSAASTSGIKRNAGSTSRSNKSDDESEDDDSDDESEADDSDDGSNDERSGSDKSEDDRSDEDRSDDDNSSSEEENAPSKSGSDASSSEEEELQQPQPKKARILPPKKEKFLPPKTSIILPPKKAMTSQQKEANTSPQKETKLSPPKKAKVSPPKAKSKAKNQSKKDEPSCDSDEAVARKLQEEEWSLRRRAAKKVPRVTKTIKKAKGSAKKNSMFTKKCLLSPELAEVMETDEMARHDVVRKVWEYVRERDLFDPNNKHFAICDDQLRRVIGAKRFRLFGMMKYLKKHVKDPN